MNIVEKKLALLASYLKQKLLYLKHHGCKFGKKIYIKSGFRVLVENGAVLEIGIELILIMVVLLQRKTG